MLDSPEPDQALWSREEQQAVQAPALVPATSSRRRGRIALGAAGAVVAILVAANVMSDPGEKGRTAPTSTTVVTTTARPTTTSATTQPPTSDGPSTQGSMDLASRPIVVDLPPGFALTSADRSAVSFDPTPGQLWANWSTDPASGSWVLLTVYPGSAGYSSGESRVWTREGVGVLTRNVDGTLRLDAERDGDLVMVLARGLPVDSLVAVADSVEVVGSKLAADGAIGDLGLRLLASSDDDAGSTATGRGTFLSVVSTSDPDDWVFVSSGPVRTFDRALRAFMLRDAQAITLGGSHLATVGIDGRSSGPQPQYIAVVDVDGTEVEVSGADRDHVISVAGGLRLGTDADFSELAATSQQPPDSPGTQLDLGSGRLRTGELWHASMYLAGSRSFVALDIGGDRSSPAFSGSMPAAVGPIGIQAVATSAGVVLFARAGREHLGAELRVAVADASYHATLSDPGPEAAGGFAALGFSELAPYHAELVAADGTVLAVLDGT